MNFLEFFALGQCRGERTVAVLLAGARKLSHDESHPDHSVTKLIAGLRAQDSAAAGEIWQRYFQQLLPLARQKLKGLSYRATDEEDLLLSVFQRFFHAASTDRFARLQDRDDLWQILLLLT